MMQPSLFDAPTGIDLRDRGTEAARDAVPDWSSQARAWIAGLPWGVEFTSEDLTSAIGLPRSEIGKDRNNAVGAAMLHASKAGLIAKLHYRPSTRRESHGAVIAVWRRG